MASLARSSSTSSLASSASSSGLARRASTLHRPPPHHAASRPTSPPHSPSRVKMTIHAPHTSPSGSRQWGGGTSHSLPRRSVPPAPSSPTRSSGASTSSVSNASKPRKRRFDPHHPPRSGWESYMYPVSLGVGLGCGMTLFSLLRDPVHLEASDSSNQDKKEGTGSGSSSSGPQFSLEQVTLICVVGVRGAGKSSQASRLSKRFEGFRILSDVLSVSDLSSRIQEARKSDVAKKGEHAETLLIVDGFPRTAEEAKEVENGTCPIFVVTYMDLPKEDFAKRFPKRSVKEEWEPSAKGLQGVVEAFRKRGNILEIAAHWDTADEVWEQVEAKVEQVLELKAMGEDVSVE